MSAIYCFFFAPALAWYLWVIPGWTGNGVVKGVADLHHSTAELIDILQFNLISTLPELLLNYGSVAFFLAGFYFLFRDQKYRAPLFPVFVLWGLAVISYFLFEMNMIGKVHDYYLFPFLPLLFILVAFGAWKLLSAKPKWKRVFFFLLAVLPLTAYLRADARWNTNAPGFAVEYLTWKDELRALGGENEYCVAGNDDSGYILLYYLDKKGWVFKDDRLDGTKLKEWTSKGATLLFTDSAVDSQPEIREQLAAKVFHRGNLRVYKLKH